MRKEEMFWMSKREWWEFKNHVPVVREDAPPEAKASYKRYCEQTEEE